MLWCSAESEFVLQHENFHNYAVQCTVESKKPNTEYLKAEKIQINQLLEKSKAATNTFIQIQLGINHDYQHNYAIITMIFKILLCARVLNLFVTKLSLRLSTAVAII